MSLSVNSGVKTAGKAATAVGAVAGGIYLVKSGKLSAAKTLIADKIQIASKGTNITDRLPKIAEKAGDLGAKVLSGVKSAGSAVKKGAKHVFEKAGNFVKS